MTSLFLHKILPVFVLPLGLSLLLVLVGLLLWVFSMPVVASSLLVLQERRDGRVLLKSRVLSVSLP